jgi:hypothetical protein
MTFSFPYSPIQQGLLIAFLIGCVGSIVWLLKGLVLSSPRFTQPPSTTGLETESPATSIPDRIREISREAEPTLIFWFGIILLAILTIAGLGYVLFGFFGSPFGP